jgi:toxin ParE1/3/4
VAKYDVTDRATAGLLAIYEYSESKFGTYQAEAYLVGFEHTFGLLADFPRVGLPADELCHGFRRYRYQSHYVFYTEEADRILIRAIVHTKENLRPQLFR